MTPAAPPASASLASVAVGLSVAVMLSGCAQAAALGDETTAGEGSPTGSAADLRDGDYRATGRYVSPNGDETIDVSVTLVDSVITAVTVTTHPTNATTRRFQNQFAEGLGDVVVGRRIDQLEVDRVAGSSLTSDGFNRALEQIMSDASS